MADDHTGPDGLRLVIDVTDADTPAMVYLGNASATYDCAIGTGDVTGDEGREIALTAAQLAWLAPFEDTVAEAYDEAREGLPQYR